MLYYDAAILHHKTGDYPECPARIIPASRQLHQMAIHLGRDRPTWNTTVFETVRRSARQQVSELAGSFPGHVAATWLGHSTLVAHKRYWQTTDIDFEKAVQIPESELQILLRPVCDATGRSTPVMFLQPAGTLENKR